MSLLPSKSSWRKVLFRSRFSVHFFLIFFFLLLCIEIYELFVYLEINPLSVVSFTNTFFHSEGCLLLMVSFCCAKLLSLIRSHLFVFVFISPLLWEVDQKDIAVVYVRVSYLCLPLRVL